MLDTITMEQTLGRVVVEITRLPQEDLSLVLQFVEHLQKQHQIKTQTNLTMAQIMAASKQRATQLKTMSRLQLKQQFDTVIEAIRQEAITKGTAIEGEWLGD